MREAKTNPCNVVSYGERCTMGWAINALFIDPIKMILEISFVFSYKAFDSIGVSIAFISLVIGFLTLPLYHIAESIQAEERAQRNILQPKVQRIKSTFKGDEQYLLLTTLYRQNHYHPLFALRNSLSLLIQIPFFIAAFQYLAHLPQVQGASLWLIDDLGKPDGLMKIGGFSINVLPLMMTLINVVASSVYSKGFSTRDKVQLFAMALVFLMLLYASPAALVVYWTLNNVFSLIKTLFYKVRQPLKILYLLMISVSVVGIGVLLHQKPDMQLTKKMVIVSLGIFIIAIPLLVKMVNWLLQSSLNDAVADRKIITMIQVSSAVTLVVLTGLVIPGNLIASSPIEFSFIDTVSTPLSFIFGAVVSGIGMWIVWPMFLWKMANPRGRALIAVLFAIIVLTSLSNVFLFSGNYGTVNNVLIFDDPDLINPTHLQMIVPIGLSILISVGIIFLVGKGLGKYLAQGLFILVVALSVSGSITAVRIGKDFRDHSKNVLGTQHLDSSLEQINPIFTLSRENKNVVVLFLDGTINSYLPIIFEQFPHLKDQFKGFVYYPNTISFGAHTLIGSPSMMGGYEYTPDELNKRNTERLVDKHNQATLVLPVLFSNEGYRSFVFDPPLPNHKWSDDFTAFEPYPDIMVKQIRGSYTQYYQREHTEDLFLDGDRTSELIRKRLPLHSIFQLLPPLARKIFYDDGTYFTAKESPGNFGEFLDSYSVLHYLSELTAIDGENGSYVFIGNETPHNPVNLQSPDYTPKMNVTNTSNPLQHDPAYGKNEYKLYQVNAASLLRVGEWLDLLKQEGAYDNTKVIIVSDHGFLAVTPAFKHFSGNAKTYGYFNPMLMVKDFDANHDFLTDDSFMTNADAPLFAVKDVITEPINPFTENNLLEMVNKDTVNVYMLNHRNTGRNTGGQFSFDLTRSYSIHDSIFEESSWASLDQ